MFEQYRSLRNKPKLPLQKYTTSPNKQNINHKNHFTPSQKSAFTSQESMHDLQILKESAISALIEKQEIIESLTSCNHEDLLSEIEQLTVRMKELELENSELKQTLEEAIKRLDEEKHEWNQQHFKLMEEIDYLKEVLLGMETSASQNLQKNGQLAIENQQLWQEMHELRTAYKIVQQQLQNQNEETYPNQCTDRIKMDDNQKIDAEQDQQEQIVEYSYQKIVFDDDFAQKSDKQKIQKQYEEHLFNFQEVLSYETEQWLEPSRENSIRQKHCLGRSLKAINLIDNYSVNSKNKGISDNESQFTAKYFGYTNQHHLIALDKTLQDSCEHIPQQPEEELLGSQHKIDKQFDGPSSMQIWWDRIICLTAGVCTGAYLVWRWKK